MLIPRAQDADEEDADDNDDSDDDDDDDDEDNMEALQAELEKIRCDRNRLDITNIYIHFCFKNI